jgi:pentatricopeptide repeat protein
MLTPWHSVRCLFEVDSGRHEDTDPRTYEERVTIWQADSFDAAIALAETEAAEYAETVNCRYLGLAQAYAMEGEPRHGAEVYSLMRDSDLPPHSYLDKFFDSGMERQGR